MPIRSMSAAWGSVPSEDSPDQFLWRGRLYVVRAVIAHWIESSAWWGGSRRALEGALPAHEHEVWRVEAQAGRSDCSRCVRPAPGHGGRPLGPGPGAGLTPPLWWHENRFDKEE